MSTFKMGYAALKKLLSNTKVLVLRDYSAETSNPLITLLLETKNGKKMEVTIQIRSVVDVINGRVPLGEASKIWNKE